MEREQIPFRVMTEPRAVSVEDCKVDEFEHVPELIFLDYLVEEFRDMGRRIRKSAAAESAEDQRIVEVDLADAEDRADLVQRNIRFRLEHHPIGADAWTAERRYGDDGYIVGFFLQLGTGGLRPAEEGHNTAIDATVTLVHGILVVVGD